MNRTYQAAWGRVREAKALPHRELRVSGRWVGLSGRLVQKSLVEIWKLHVTPPVHDFLSRSSSHRLPGMPAGLEMFLKSASSGLFIAGSECYVGDARQTQCVLLLEDGALYTVDTLDHCGMNEIVIDAYTPEGRSPGASAGSTPGDGHGIERQITEALRGLAVT